MRKTAKVRTHSGATYLLRNIEEIEFSNDTLENALVRVLGTYRAELARLDGDIPMTDLSTHGLDINEDWHGIQFERLPEVGNCFFYYHDRWGACRSSTVAEISE